MTTPSPGPRSRQSGGIVLLFCGASHMGKSFFAKTVMQTEYGATHRQIDKVYTAAVKAANMVPSGRDANRGERRNAEKDARRHARDRNWPSAEAKGRFFTAYTEEIVQACRYAFDRGTPLVLEGGSLRYEEELEIVVTCVRHIYGNDARLVRVTVEVPYARWLQNRINRMLKSEVATATLKMLSARTYEAEIAASAPKATVQLLDCKISDIDDLRRLMDDFDSDDNPANTATDNKNAPSTVAVAAYLQPTERRGWARWVMGR